jgi:hypothetical protein
VLHIACEVDTQASNKTAELLVCYAGKFKVALLQLSAENYYLFDYYTEMLTDIRK